MGQISMEKSQPAGSVLSGNQHSDLLNDLNAEGNPGDIVTDQLVHDVSRLRALVIVDPVSGIPMIVPAKRRRGFA